MRSHILKVFILFLSIGLFSTQLEARRFGGGLSVGKSWSRSSQRSSSNANYFNRNQNTAAANKRFSNRSGMFKGAMMGLLAGGLIGSLLMGGGFHGLQFFDILMMLFVGFMIFKFIQKRKMATQGGYANASPGSFRQQFQGHNNFGSSGNSSSGKYSYMPQSFNEARFIDGAKNHFLKLQVAWDKNDRHAIYDYCETTVANQILETRADYLGEQQTQILELNARLIDIIKEDNNMIAGIEFSGMSQANGGQPEPFKELWSIERLISNTAQAWKVVGIEQKN